MIHRGSIQAIFLILFLHTLNFFDWSFSPVQAHADPATEDVSRLRTLSYIGYNKTAEKREGVLVYDRQRAFSGLNLFKMPDRAVIIDMNGSILHTWHLPAGVCFGHVALDDTGQLLTHLHVPNQPGEGCSPGTRHLGRFGDLLKLDWNSNVLLRIKGAFHHDFDFAPDGTWYALEQKNTTMNSDREPVRVIDDHLVHFAADGTVLKSLSLLNLFRDQIHLPRLAASTAEEAGKGDKESDRPPLDVLHTNSVQLLRTPLDSFAPAGSVLISMREIDTIAIVDLAKGKVLWKWGPGDLQGQHQPTLLPNGNLLIYDNGVRRKATRIIELNPKSNQIVWEFPGTRGTRFYSDNSGSAQQLPNGDILIADSTNGRALEVTRDGDTVWEYLLPLTKEALRPSLYRIKRLSKEEENVVRAKLVFESQVEVRAEKEDPKKE